MSARKPRPASPHPRRNRQHRARPTPRWLNEQQDLDEIARRRCVMILTVLSGAQPVSDAISEAKISRGLYYQLETRAIRAMLGALTPGAEPDGRGNGMTQRIAQLEKKTAQLEKEKRRSERLLFLTRQVVKGPVTTGLGRPRRRAKPSSTSNGRKPSTHSSRTQGAPSVSTPSAAGGAAR